VLDGREHLFRVRVGVPDVFAYQAQPSINEQLVRGLMRGEYIDKRENILLIGNSGTGKIHLACALAFAACAMGRKVRFYTVTGLVTELIESREENILISKALPEALPLEHRLRM
jgi:DNA replication protein DnaC